MAAPMSLFDKPITERNEVERVERSAPMSLFEPITPTVEAEPMFAPEPEELRITPEDVTEITRPKVVTPEVEFEVREIPQPPTVAERIRETLTPAGFETAEEVRPYYEKELAKAYEIGDVNRIVELENTWIESYEKYRLPLDIQMKKIMSIAAYAAGRPVSEVIEKPFYATSSLGLRGGAKIAEFFGNDIIADELYSASQYMADVESNGVISPYIDPMRRKLSEEVYERDKNLHMVLQSSERLVDLTSFLMMMKAMPGKPAKFAQKYGLTARSAAMAGYRLNRLAAIATITKEGKLSDRFKNASWMVLYSSTPYLVNKFGLTGITAMTADAALNTALSSGQYWEMIQKEGGLTDDVIRNIIPDLGYNIMLAWNTRGSIKNQQIDEWYKNPNNKIAQNMSKKEFRKFIKTVEKHRELDRKSPRERQFLSDEHTKKIRSVLQSTKEYLKSERGEIMPPEEFLDRKKYTEAEIERMRETLKEEKAPETKMPKETFETKQAKGELIVGKIAYPEEARKSILSDVTDMYKDAMEIAQTEGRTQEVKRLQEELQFIGGKVATPSELGKMRQTIIAWKNIKGISGKQLQEVIRQVTGQTKLKPQRVKITGDQYKDILSRLKKMRPNKIDNKTVIKLKTENKIQSMKENMITRDEMTEQDYNNIVDELGLPTTRYVSRNRYITETEGNELIRTMKNYAPIIKERIAVERALMNNPKIKEVYDDMEKYSETKVRGPGEVATSGWQDARYFYQALAEQTGIPFDRQYEKMNTARLDADSIKSEKIRMVQEAAGDDYRNIINDENSLRRIDRYIASRLPAYVKGKPQAPANITASEKRMADTMIGILKDYEVDVRYLRFLDWYDYGEKIPDAPTRELNKAKDIFEVYGDDALKEWLAGRSWGIIRSGYDIGELFDPKIEPMRGRIGVSKGHLRSRQSIVYREQERNIFQRFTSYVRQMEYRKHIVPEVRTLESMVNNNRHMFRDQARIMREVSNNMREMQGIKENYGDMETWILAGGGQMARTLFLDPRKWIRNLCQNLAFYTSLEDATKVLDSPMTEADREYFKKYVSQNRGIREDLFLRGESDIANTPLGRRLKGTLLGRGVGKLNEWADRYSLYPVTDEVNRAFSFRLKLADVRIAIRNNPDNIKDMMRDAKFGDFKPQQRKMALEIYAKEGADAMARYLAKEFTNNIHFMYDRAQKGMEEQGGVNKKIIGNLITFKKGYVQEIAKHINKLRPSEKAVEEMVGGRRRSVRALTKLLLVAGLVGEGYQLLTGDERNPYNPINIVSDLGFGGIMTGAQEHISSISRDTFQVIMGDRDAIGSLINSMTDSADAFLPFYDDAINVIESLTDMKQIDRYALRKVREALDSEYETRGIDRYKANRSLFEMMQHMFFGTEPGMEKRRTTELFPTRKREAKLFE
jgi:hypothetical protein